MPTATDLVTDLPADFEVFGQAVATSMADLLGGTSGQVLAKNSNTDMDFVWVTSDDANAIQNTIVDAKGDLIGATAADTPARLAVGTNGQVLTADSTAATGLKWATPSGGGKVLQVKNFTIFNWLSSSTNTWVTTNLTLSITPTLATSKVLAIVQHCGCAKSDSNAYLEIKLRRDTTDILLFEDRGAFTNDGSFNAVGTCGTSYLDSPATTSAISYNTQFRSGGNTASVHVGYGSAAYSTITLMEIGA